MKQHHEYLAIRTPNTNTALHTKIIMLLVLLLAPTAAAQAVILSAQATPVAPTGFGATLTIDVPFLDLDEGTTHLAARAAGSVTFGDTTQPAADAGLTLITQGDGMNLYAGTTAGIWWSTVDDVPCWDLTWLIHGGLDLEITHDIHARIETQFAPLLGGLRISTGLAIPLGN